jgi:hypothetical protein
MMGKISLDFDDDWYADARPFGRCKSGTRIGLCLRIAFFFWDLPIAKCRKEFVKMRLSA